MTVMVHAFKDDAAPARRALEGSAEQAVTVFVTASDCSDIGP
jgi:hypothetical protein